ncbi:signal transduction histidine kinase/ligand-binding sensor domain-containing protein/DNA-binding response OmpR family regulator [Parabacteroides sp. PF5-5]|uniref:hybrid sensor histidine kinase/response regulator transcription factor n=1 Tax=unclassified Parabacteroides TaxID=2649774 RepID=UPI002475228B|nr:MULTISPECIES: hybrid sensor histidine kinase/response regulator transcription factor [unclassified Parabacteroides]MDH6306804.1 signal transduction histidine kinase/ligand-binding sensor domain-containing protein/DNA-binding response OmpR family regulator [Parabacteroides sp. PH5-39]MDH6317690.1 signal transduction histidine kinase/ligand-binding sensor domain-containing protein/DNA-binding response OmpR family regulator [Parabacteroides sp. PF5-13]MDH6321516.1 signal transduction histidine k
MFIRQHVSYICSLLLLFLLIGKEDGQAEEMYFRHYNNKQGLSHNTVYCSLQDRKGFMWFGTDDGLNRFDGHTFRVYRYNSYQSENSLPNDRIRSLFEDSSGTLWICTNYATCYYDDTIDGFHPFTLSGDKATDAEDFFVVNEDKQKQLWLASNNRIVCYSPADKTCRLYPADAYFQPVCMIMTTEGQALFSSASDLYAYKPETDRFTRTAILTEKELQEQVHISAICEVPNVGVLIGTNKKGLKLYHYQSMQTETVLPEIQVRAITAYNHHTYWIASESGVYIYNILNRQTTHLKKSLTNEYTISDNAIYSITKDREGGMWVGSFFGGISYLPQKYVSFDRFIGGKTHPQMPGNAIREISPDMYGNLWLGTEDNGINRYNLQTGEITNFSLNNPQHPLSATNIHGLFADGNKLWVGTFNKGIDVLELPSGKLIRRYSQSSTNNGLSSDFVLCFHKLADGNMLIGTSTGTVLYEAAKDRFSRWENIHALVRQIYTDTKGNIWVVSDNGLFRYSSSEKKLTRYTSDIHRSQSLGSNNTTSVFEDSKGRIWVTTVYGFSLYNDITDSFNRITVEDGLPSNIVYRILEDDEHTFWITTANGLVKFNPETHAMRVFSYTDGLHETQFNYSSSYKAPDGMMYMGTINGMIAFNPRHFITDSYTPPIHITDIHVPGGMGFPSKENRKGVTSLSLPHNKATFTLSYVALSFTSPDAIQYAYKLEGVDTEWNYMKQNNSVTFANLSPGKYTFKVRSTNSSGTWQNNEIQLPIVIVPPFWATPWAYLMYGLLLVLLIVLFYRYKKSKLEDKHRLEQEKFESQKEKELFDAKIQFFTFITHEIRTPLTLIKAPLEKILKSNDGSPDTKTNLQTIEKNTQRLLDLSNQLLDFRKTESKGFKLNFVKTDITLWIESIIQRFRPAFEKENKTFIQHIPPGSFFGDIDREAFSKIISNMMTNALKYSDTQVSFELIIPQEKEETFRISVTNDGYLVPETEMEKIFSPFYRVKETENIQGSGIGLSLARSLAEYHQGSLSYQHTPDRKNCFILTLPVVQEKGYQLEETESKPLTVPIDPNNHKPPLLIVEDQADMRRFIADELSNTYQVLEADNGKSALSILSDYPVKLIISDVMMPVMDGFDFCNEVKNDINYSHIPFILLTAQHNLQSRLKGLNNGADAYIEKPFSIELLTTQISNLLKSRELLNRTYLEKPLSSTVSLAASPIDEIFLSKFNTYLEENLTNDSLNIEAIAAEMHMSTSGLYRKVKGISGLSPIDFIRVVRLKKAVQLMQQGEKRINEIAFKVGFSSPSYFSTSFQKQYGKSPSEYMKQYFN